jgi:uncharacterized membrane protein YgdD (TMEM256/DUF423 family)
MDQKRTLITGALLGGLGVSIGAFGAHALRDTLLAAGRLDTFELAVRYHFYHTFAVLITGLLMTRYTSRMLGYAALFFLIGIIFFSGSLYALCFTGQKVFGAITPIGGTLFVVGWVMVAIGISSSK